MILFAMMLAAQAAPPSQDGTWRSCVIAAATKWARNNETADVIAEGAFGACASQEPTMSAEQRLRVKQQAIATVLDRRRP